MVVAAGLLLLVGLGSFVGGLVTGREALYWVCVAVCGVAAVLLLVNRLRTAREARGSARRTPGPPSRPVTPAAAGSAEPAVDPGRDDVPREPEPLPPPEPLAVPMPAGATAFSASVPDYGPDEPPTGAHAAPVGNGHLEELPPRRGAHQPREEPVDAAGAPGEEDVEVTDLLLVVDLADEVLVVDEEPRYHLAGCRFIDGRWAIPLPMVEARTDGFTPCATCRPVRHLAETERARRRAARGN